MASRRQDRGRKRPAPRLYLVTQGLDDADTTARALEMTLGAGDIAAILLRLPRRDEESLDKYVKQAAPLVQNRGTALILDGHAELVGRTGADGAHLTGYDALKDALPTLKPERIAGAGGLYSRHDAMLAGEAGADYVMFGEPDPAGRRPSFEALIARVAWWSELFELPCVGFAQGPEEIGALAQAGADFVALADLVWNDPQGPAASIAAVTLRLSRMEPV